MEARTTRKRAAPVGQENIAPSAGATQRGPVKSLQDAAAAALNKQPTATSRFGFNANAQQNTVAPAAAAGQQQVAKRRKTNEAADTAAAAAAAAGNTPSRKHQAASGLQSPSAASAAAASSASAAAASALSTSTAIPPQSFAPAADLLASCWRTEMLDDSLTAECKSALAIKVTASKFDYKERIGQLDAQMKSLRKVVAAIMKKGEVFLSEATRIEASLHEQVAQAKNAHRDVCIEKAALHEKAQRALQIVKQLQAQRDGLLSDAKSTAAQVAEHSAVLDAAQTLQADTEAKLTQCTRDLQETMAALDQAQQEREQSKILLVEMQEQIDAAGAQIHGLEQEKLALIQSTEDQALTIHTSEEKIADLENQMTQTREQYVTLMAQWSSLQSVAKKSESDGVALQKVVVGLRAELEASEQQLIESRAQLAAQQVSAAEAKTKAQQELSSVRAALQSEIATLRKQIDESLQRNTEESALVAANLEQLSTAKSSLAESLQKSNMEIVSLRGSLLHSTERSGTLENEVRKIEGELALVKLQLQQKNEECFLTVQSFANIQKFHEERQTILQGEKEALEKVKAELVTRVASVESGLKQTQGELEQNQAALAERNAQLESLRAEHASVVATASADRESWAAAQTELKATLASLTASTSAQIASLESAVAALTARAEAETLRATNLSRELTSFKALSGVSSESQMENLVKLSLEAETLRVQVQDKGALASELVETKRLLQEALRRVAESEGTRRALHNTIQELKGNIRVFTRVRPMFHAGAKNDITSGEAHAATGDDSVSAVDVSADGKKVRLDLGTGAPRAQYSFDCVFGPQASQKDVFDEVSPLVQSALDGYNVCLFSYGQTGSGKTWSMSGGSGEQRGIIPRAVEKVLEQAQILSTGGWTYTLEASYLEIYNESIRDLLSKDSKDTDLDIKRDPSGRTLIPGLTRGPIATANDVVSLMAKAAKNRSTAATNMNERSSRSHSVFTLYLTASNPLSKASLSGSLNLCDLAGSERLARSGVSGERMKETQSINKSLSSMSDVFLALSQKQAHVPFRNSKLTYLLQPCLSGDGKTAMLINLNPALSSASESHCTLKFAAQVSQVELGKPKKQGSGKSAAASDDAMDTTSSSAPAAAAAAAPSASAQVAASRQSLSGAAPSSSLMRPTTASSATKKPVGGSIPRPSTGTAMRR